MRKTVYAIGSLAAAAALDAESDAKPVNRQQTVEEQLAELEQSVRELHRQYLSLARADNFM